MLHTQQRLLRERRETPRIDEINALDTPDSSKLFQFTIDFNVASK